MISMRWAERPAGVIGKAYERAADLIDYWGSQGGNEDVRYMMVGWPFVGLAEKIAGLLLDESGYDEELLERAIDGDYKPGETAGDLDAELERTRRTS